MQSFSTSFESVVLAAVLAACAADGAGDQTPLGSGPTTVPGGPVILSFGANTPRLASATQVLTLSVVLTDPDGVDDIVGGTLVDDLGTTRGTFATSAQEGAYEITRRWNELTLGRPDVPGMLGEGVPLQLTAKFFDQAGHVSSQSVGVELDCGDTDPSTLSLVMPEMCVVAARCGTSEGGTGCVISPDTGVSGDEACAAGLGKSCVRCYQGSQKSCNYVDDPTDYNHYALECECQG